MLLSLDPQVLIILSFCLLFALTFHEFAHAYVAYLCGDPTAKNLGRLTLNPFAHLDLLGSFMLLTIGLGYAKPVPVNPRNYKYNNADLYIAAAGPGMNLLLTIAGALVLKVMFNMGMLETINFPVKTLLFWFMLINMNLCLFNLLPFGPLDGSYVLPHFLPFDLRRRYQFWNMQYGTYVLLALMVLSYVMPAFSPFQWITVLSKTVIVAML